MSTLLGVAGLRYALPDGTPLLTDLTVHLGPERTGLVGRNGVGKTTLLEILAGQLEPTAGRVVRDGRVAYLPQSAAPELERTVAEALGVGPVWSALARVERGEGTPADLDRVAGHWDLPARVEAALARLGLGPLDPDRTLGTLSGGDTMRVRLAGLLLRDPDVLLLDEPTNHLDADARRHVRALVEGWAGGLVVVSHDRELLGAVDQVAELTPAGLRLYGGGFEAYREQRRVEQAAAVQAAADAERELRRAERAAQEAQERQASRSASGRRHGRRTGMSKMEIATRKRSAEATEGRLGGQHERVVDRAEAGLEAAREALPEDRQIRVDLEAGGVPAGKRIVEARGLRYRHPGAEADVWPEPLDLRVLGGERVAVVGPNGSGKTTLFELLRGLRQPTGGTLFVGTDRVAVLDQRVGDLDDAATLLENARRAAPSRPEHELRLLLARFLFEGDAVFKPAGVLSGGERLRAGLACALLADQAPDLLVLDEPTNNLDLESLEEVASALAGYRGTLLVASHDRAFLDDVGVEREVALPG